ncbi:MAG: hypothetical protein C0454_15595 [Parvibaculum sp.]|nr:hypothetical protein [Parvibaculum sp.]
MKTITGAALFAGALMLAACGNSDNMGPAQPAPGVMGSTATPHTGDMPAKNSQSLPIVRPE